MIYIYIYCMIIYATCSQSSNLIHKWSRTFAECFCPLPTIRASQVYSEAFRHKHLQKLILTTSRGKIIRLLNINWQCWCAFELSQGTFWRPLLLQPFWPQLPLILQPSWLPQLPVLLQPSWLPRLPLLLQPPWLPQLPWLLQQPWLPRLPWLLQPPWLPQLLALVAVMHSKRLF